MEDYGRIVDLDMVTIEDCETLYDKKNICTIIEDGRITNFTKED